MTTRPKAAKVSNVTTRSQTRTTNTTNFLTTPDPIGFYLENADKRNLRLLSKGSNQAFFDNLECADAQELQEELQAMRNEPEPCKNTAKVIYNPKKGMQRAIMCAIMSTGQLHVYVNTGDLETFLASESVKCFDKNYELKLTLLYPKAQQTLPSQPNLYCHGGFHALAATCVDAKELEEMRQSKSLECRNSTRVWYNPEENMRYAIMCAIISVDQTLHLYVNQEHLPQFLSSESVKCFDRNYTLRLTLLYPKAQQDPPPRPNLRCAGGFRALKGGWARNGRLRGEVQVVRFTGNTYVAKKAFTDRLSLMELLDVNTIQEIHDDAFKACIRLQKLGDMPALKIIGNNAFDCCFSLEGIGDMPALQKIKRNVFKDCFRIKELGNMPNLEEIGIKAFMNCRKLRILPKSLSALKTIRREAFRSCLELETLGEMRSLKTIGRAAFEGNVKLQKLCLPESLDTVDEKAFEGCPLEKLSVKPGAEFDCYCENLASKLRLLDGVSVTGDGDPYRVRAGPHDVVV